MGFLGGYSEEPTRVFKYPGVIPWVAKNYTFGDDWLREALNPTDAPALYTESITGTGTNVPRGTASNLEMATSANAGDKNDVRTSAFKFFRQQPFAAQRTAEPLGKVAAEITFNLTSGADVEGFIGILAATNALAAPPTTTRHLGIEWDVSAGANFLLTSANGTTQVTTDTGVAVNTSAHLIRITWTGEDNALVEMVNSTTGAVGASQSVTAFNGSSGNLYQLHFYVETETTAAKTLRVFPWRVAFT